MTWRDWVADPAVLQYCACGHAEELHRPICSVARCDCERFSAGKP